MTLTIELTPEIEQKLEAEAKRSGISTSDLAKTVIEERFTPQEKHENEFKSRYIGRVETRDYSGDDEWLRKNGEKHKGKYLAKYGNRLIASGNSLKEVTKKARAKGFPDEILTYIEPSDAN